MAEFLMPSLGADMEAGMLVEWLKKPGDPVKRGEVIAVVETQKGAIEVEVFEDGILDGYLVDLGAKVPVGTPLAMIRGQGEEPPAAKPEPEPAEVAPKAESTKPPAPASEMTSPDLRAPVAESAAPPPLADAQGGSGRLRVSPAARKRAAELGIDLALVTGSGPGGAIDGMPAARSTVN